MKKQSNLKKHFSFFSLFVLCVFLSNAQPVSWTKYYDATIPNTLGLDGTTGAVSVKYGPLNGSIYAYGTKQINLPAVISGFGFSRELTVVRYDNVTGNKINEVSSHIPLTTDLTGHQDIAKEMVIGADGSVYIVGTYFYNTFYGYDIVVIKYNSSLVEQWRYYFDGSTSSYDNADGITLDNSGNVCITGTISDNGNGKGKEIVVGKLTSSGSLVYEYIFNNSGTNNDIAKDISTDNFGNAYVCGYSTTATNGTQFELIKLNSTGVFQWKKGYNGTTGLYNDIPATVLVDKNTGYVYVAGAAYNTAGNTDLALLQYNAGGVLNFIKKVNNPGNSADEATHIVVDGSSNVYVGGMVDRDVSANTNHDLIIKKFSSTGTLLGTKKFNGTNQEIICGDLAISSSGYIYQTGWGIAPPPINGNTFIAVKYNTNFAYQFNDLLTPPGSSCGEGYLGWSIAVNPANSEAVIGGRYFLDCPGANTEQWMIRRYSPSARTSDENASMSSNLNLYPNPANSIINFEISNSSSTNFKAEIYDIQGRLIENLNIDDNSTSIDISNLENGIYVLVLRNEENTFTKKFIKE
jgi:Secretion system C-terminal sorting domain